MTYGKVWLVQSNSIRVFGSRGVDFIRSFVAQDGRVDTTIEASCEISNSVYTGVNGVYSNP